MCHNITFPLACKISIFLRRMFVAGAARGIHSTHCSAHLKAARVHICCGLKKRGKKCKRKWLVHFLATHAASLWQGSSASLMSESLKLGYAWDFRHYYSGGMSQSLQRAHRPCPGKDSSNSIQKPIPAPLSLKDSVKTLVKWHSKSLQGQKVISPHIHAHPL